MADRLRNMIFRTVLPVSQAEAFAWHQRPGVLDRLLPPWEKVRVTERGHGIDIGTRVAFSTRLGPFPVRWLAEHTACSPPDYFEDVQRRGPFRYWRHRHQFVPQDAYTSTLEDYLEYGLPGGRLGEMLVRKAIEKKIERMFTYRHEVTHADLSAHAPYREHPRLSVGITGARGMIGHALATFLSAGGHSITEISRSNHPSSLTKHVVWNPGFDQSLSDSAEGLDAIIHLAGENIAARRWTAREKKNIFESRVYRTRKICELLSSLRNPPPVFLSASAVGYYGESGTQTKGDTAVSGEGFLADLASEWEAACQPAIDAGIRVVYLRFGMVLSPQGGVLKAMLPLFRLGAGGRIGDGNQFWSWISLDDAVGAVHHALMDGSLEGPINVVSPSVTTNREFADSLAHTINRRSLLPLPATATQMLLGEMAKELLFPSIRAVPGRLLESGYNFRYIPLDKALRHLLGR